MSNKTKAAGARRRHAPQHRKEPSWTVGDLAAVPGGLGTKIIVAGVAGATLAIPATSAFASPASIVTKPGSSMVTISKAPGQPAAFRAHADAPPGLKARSHGHASPQHQATQQQATQQLAAEHHQSQQTRHWSVQPTAGQVGTTGTTGSTTGTSGSMQPGQIPAPSGSATSASPGPGLLLEANGTFVPLPMSSTNVYAVPAGSLIITSDGNLVSLPAGTYVTPYGLITVAQAPGSGSPSADTTTGTATGATTGAAGTTTGTAGTAGTTTGTAGTAGTTTSTAGTAGTTTGPATGTVYVNPGGPLQAPPQQPAPVTTPATAPAPVTTPPTPASTPPAPFANPPVPVTIPGAQNCAMSDVVICPSAYSPAGDGTDLFQGAPAASTTATAATAAAPTTAAPITAAPVTTAAVAAAGTTTPASTGATGNAPMATGTVAKAPVALPTTPVAVPNAPVAAPKAAPPPVQIVSAIGGVTVADNGTVTPNGTVNLAFPSSGIGGSLPLSLPSATPAQPAQPAFPPADQNLLLAGPVYQGLIQNLGQQGSPPVPLPAPTPNLVPNTGTAIASQAAPDATPGNLVQLASLDGVPSGSFLPSQSGQPALSRSLADLGPSNAVPASPAPNIANQFAANGFDANGSSVVSDVSPLPAGSFQTAAQNTAAQAGPTVAATTPSPGDTLPAGSRIVDPVSNPSTFVVNDANGLDDTYPATTVLGVPVLPGDTVTLPNTAQVHVSGANDFFPPGGGVSTLTPGTYQTANGTTLVVDGPAPQAPGPQAPSSQASDAAAPQVSAQQGQAADSLVQQAQNQLIPDPNTPLLPGGIAPNLIPPSGGVVPGGSTFTDANGVTYNIPYGSNMPVTVTIPDPTGAGAGQTISIPPGGSINLGTASAYIPGNRDQLQLPDGTYFVGPAPAPGQPDTRTQVIIQTSPPPGLQGPSAQPPDPATPSQATPPPGGATPGGSTQNVTDPTATQTASAAVTPAPSPAQVPAQDASQPTATTPAPADTTPPAVTTPAPADTTPPADTVQPPAPVNVVSDPTASDPLGGVVYAGSYGGGSIGSG